jgi:hypothetical protein
LREPTAECCFSCSRFADDGNSFVCHVFWSKVAWITVRNQQNPVLLATKMYGWEWQNKFHNISVFLKQMVCCSVELLCAQNNQLSTFFPSCWGGHRGYLMKFRRCGSHYFLVMLSIPLNGPPHNVTLHREVKKNI